jgi:hypothetical protein
VPPALDKPNTVSALSRSGIRSPRHQRFCRGEIPPHLFFSGFELGCARLVPDVFTERMGSERKKFADNFAKNTGKMRRKKKNFINAH